MEMEGCDKLDNCINHAIMLELLKQDGKVYMCKLYMVRVEKGDNIQGQSIAWILKSLYIEKG